MKQNEKWVPLNGFTQSQVDNRVNGISPDVWLKNYNTFRGDSANAVNKLALDNRLYFTQYQFDMLMDFCWTNGNFVFSNDNNGTYTYDFVNIMLEMGFLTNATADQKYRFETAFGNLTQMDGIRTSGMWARRMSQLSVFWEETDAKGAYQRKDYGNSAATKRAADDWLTTRGLEPTER